MELNELLTRIKNEFPDKSIDISESLELIMGTIDDVINSINTKIFNAITSRDLSNVEKYTDLIKEINIYETKIDEIINFTRIEQNEIIEENTEENINKTLPNYEDYVVDNKLEHALYENFTHIRPFGFKINNSELVEVKTWQDMMLKTCEMLFYIDQKKFINFENNKSMNGKKNKYFSTNKGDLREPEKVANKVYIETNMSGNAIRNLIVKILKEYEIKVSNYKVYFRADYTNINKE